MKKYFITGLLTLLPLAITIEVLGFFIRFLSKPFMGLMEQFVRTAPWIPLYSESSIRWASQILVIVALFSFVVILGFIARTFFIKSLIHFGDKLLHKIPIINKLYRSFQEIVHSLFISEKDSFKEVVLIPFPGEGSYCLGLISRNAPEPCRDMHGEDLVSVLIPSTPNPANGFLLMFQRKELIYLDMTTDEALKYIISCGVILPEGKKS
jgi:uncharacterized membrane protein